MEYTQLIHDCYDKFQGALRGNRSFAAKASLVAPLVDDLKLIFKYLNNGEITEKTVSELQEQDRNAIKEKIAKYHKDSEMKLDLNGVGEIFDQTFEPINALISQLESALSSQNSPKNTKKNNSASQQQTMAHLPDERPLDYTPHRVRLPFSPDDSTHAIQQSLKPLQVVVTPPLPSTSFSDSSTRSDSATSIPSNFFSRTSDNFSSAYSLTISAGSAPPMPQTSVGAAEANQQNKGDAIGADTRPLQGLQSPIAVKMTLKMAVDMLKHCGISPVKVDVKPGLAVEKLTTLFKKYYPQDQSSGSIFKSEEDPVSHKYKVSVMLEDRPIATADCALPPEIKGNEEWTNQRNALIKNCKEESAKKALLNLKIRWYKDFLIKVPPDTDGNPTSTLLEFYKMHSIYKQGDELQGVYRSYMNSSTQAELPIFECSLMFKKANYATGRGETKRRAREAASRQLLRYLNEAVQIVNESEVSELEAMVTVHTTRPLFDLYNNAKTR